MSIVVPAVDVTPDARAAELRERPQWVCWRYGDERNGKSTKLPVEACNGQSAKTNDPATWATFNEALKAYNTDGGVAGIGYVLADDDPYVGIDLDDCLDADGKPDARAAISSAAKRAAAISPITFSPVAP